MLDILFFVGFAICLFGGIAFLIAAFSTGIIWGLACLFIAPVQIIYLIIHFREAKGPFLIQVVGGIIMFLASYRDGMPQGGM
ncbi:hypothetical protein [Desulfotalea psychrophila]|uniref:Hypothetical membrane protein n=1 Tax=Desulfotalea psychrophila (strain LSv54 / DSM 12343) TaxID=177439 RepID=Q6AQA9_DESPS|nr:hypothetical protein [Desulfotalea psychrophila]CAG35464.1 hypothetical membrane protein [Desulfotalea psychrophila LSv54]